MKRFILTTFVVVIALATPVIAQQAGDNINVLPWHPFDPNDEYDIGHYLGDGYLQRQLEPTIAASTRNPDHLLAFFNDYRAVNIWDDPGLGETQNIAMVFNTVRTLMASIFPWSEIPKIPLVAPAAAAEAWVGMSRSYDGGLTWSGGFLPGATWDESPASTASPVWGLEAATDPVIAAGPCGQFYVVFVAFTRFDESKIAVARYEDLNNNPGGDTIHYLGTTVIESGNNAEYGYFLDKPDLEVDIYRPQGGDLCAQRVYVSYSTFNGLTKDGKFQSKINFAVSEDYGATFTTQKLNPPYKQNQGSAIAIDPRPGEPSDENGGGSIYMVWRHFFSPHAILMTKSTNYGAKWNKPEVLTTGKPMEPFDQPTISTQIAQENGWIDGDTGLPETAFRSNGFPAAAVGANGAVYAAWQENVHIDPENDSYAFREPLSADLGGSPRIVAVRSDNGGDTWTGLSDEVTANYPAIRRAVDISDRDVPLGSPKPGLPPDPVGYGTLPQERSSGPQVMPRLSFGGGRFMLAFYEARGRIINYGSGTPDERIEPESTVSSLSNYISGYDRVLDFRAAILDHETGQFQSSAQVSRYPLRAGANLLDGTEDLIDVAPVNPPCLPDHDYLQNLPEFVDVTPFPACIRQVNRANAPTSAAGTSPFIGDYTGLEPFVQFVVDGNGAWRWASSASDVPTQGFHSIWADNRHLIPPQTGDPKTEWKHYVDYDPPGTGNLSCINSGSRNTDVLTSRIDASLVINAPTTYRLLAGQPVSFPFSLSNQSGETQAFTLQIVDPPVGLELEASLRPYPDVKSVDIEIFPYSSTSQTVYVAAGEDRPVTVAVLDQQCVVDCSPLGSVTFNAADTMANFAPDTSSPGDSFSPTVDGDAFVINYVPENAFVINDGVDNAFVINPTVDNAFVINNQPENAFVINAFVINAFVINPAIGDEDPPPPEEHTVYGITDTTWTVSPGGSTAATSFLPLINIDNAEEFLDNYIFQIIVHKGSLYGTLDSCAAENGSSLPVNQAQILSTYAQGGGNVDPENAFVINPTPKNAFVINPGEPNAFVINSTFAMAPPEELGAPVTTSELKIDTQDPWPTADLTLKAPRAPDTVNITLRAYQINKDLGTFQYNPFEAGDRPSLTVMSMDCDPTIPGSKCYDANGPDLVAIGLDPSLSFRIDAENPPVFEKAIGEKFTFPENIEEWSLDNQGDETARAENQNLEHGVLLCGVSVVHEAWDTNRPIKPTTCVELASVQPDVNNDLEPEEDPLGVLPFTGISISLDDVIDTEEEDPPGGDSFYRYIVLYVDHLRDVSETNEVNNAYVVPISIMDANDPPEVSIENIDSPIFEGAPVQLSGSFTDEGDEGNHAVVWNFGDGSPVDESGELTVSHVYADDGSYTVTLTVTDDRGATDSAELPIEVLNLAPTADAKSITVVAGSSEDVVLTASDLGIEDELTFSIENEPTFGAVNPLQGAFSGDPLSATVTYRAAAGTCGSDSFTYVACDEDSCSGPATVDVSIAPFFDWFFYGLLDPYTPPLYTATAGSSIPLSWQYRDALNAIVDSESVGFTIQIKGWEDEPCGTGGIDVSIIEDSGSSSLRYSSGTHKYNWQTNDENGDPLLAGCYEVNIVSNNLCQIESGGPFYIQLQ